MSDRAEMLANDTQNLRLKTKVERLEAANGKMLAALKSALGVLRERTDLCGVRAYSLCEAAIAEAKGVNK